MTAGKVGVSPRAQVPVSILLSLYFVLAVLPGLLRAQQDAGSVRVLVEDVTSAVVANATVKLTNANTNTSTTQPTNESGYATFSPVSRGLYIVEVSQSGFRPVRVNNVEVDVNQNRLVRATLEVAAVTEAVEVTAAAAPLQTEDASVGQVVRGNVIVELPLAARRYTDLTLLVPGATESTLDPNIRGPGWLVVNGNYHSQNNFILDGFDNNQGTTNLQSRSAQVVQPSPDALSEFKVMTNSFSAEFGRAAGAVVNASIRSGANDVHGSAWWFNRSSKLAANSWRGNLIGAPKDQLKWNQAGGTIGGPIKKNKLFYFGDYEGFFSTTSELQITQVPTTGMHTGDFRSLTFALLDPTTNQQFPNNVIPQGRIDSLGKKVIDLFPQPNLPGSIAPGGRVRENYGVQLPITEDDHKFDIRSDYYAAQNDRFFFRYSFSDQNLFKNPTFPGPADTGNEDGGSQLARNQSLGVSWNRTISPAIVNEARFGYNHTTSSFIHATVGGTKGTAFGFKGIPPDLDQVGGIPRIVMSNYHNLGTGPWRPQFQNPHSYQASDTLSIIKGPHSMKMGFDFRHKNNNWVDLQYRTVAYTFQGRYTNDDASDLLIGFPQQLSGQTFFVAEQLQQNYSAYVQDDWKLRPNLTVNLGLRYEYATPYWGRPPHPNINVDLPTGQLIFASGTDLILGARRAGNKYTQDPDHNNIGPRLGVSYQANQRLVLRGGYGVFYNGEDFHGSTGNLLLNAPNTFVVTLQRVGTGPPPLLISDTIPSGFLNPAAIQTSNLGFQSRVPDFKATTVQQWNVAVQYLVMKDSTFEVAYVGNRGRNLDGGIGNVNRAPYGSDGSIPANRPYPQYNTLELLESKAHTNYNAVQAKFEKRFTGSLYNLTSYAYASGLAEAGGFAAGNGVQRILFVNRIPTGDWRGERAFNRQLTRQRLSIANVWQVPVGRNRRYFNGMGRALDLAIGGWEASTIVTAKSGLPVDVTLGANGTDPISGQPYTFLPNSGGTSLRPNRVGNPNTGIDPGTDRFHFLDVRAYRLQPIDTPGNAARNSAWGPPLWNIDMGINKRFGITERMHADFRFEMFNMFNHTNFRNPDGVWNNSTFGVISDAYAPRQIQIAVRFAF